MIQRVMFDRKGKKMTEVMRKKDTTIWGCLIGLATIVLLTSVGYAQPWPTKLIQNIPIEELTWRDLKRPKAVLLDFQALPSNQRIRLWNKAYPSETFLEEGEEPQVAAPWMIGCVGTKEKCNLVIFNQTNPKREGPSSPAFKTADFKSKFAKDRYYETYFYPLYLYRVTEDGKRGGIYRRLVLAYEKVDRLYGLETIEDIEEAESQMEDCEATNTSEDLGQNRASHPFYAKKSKTYRLIQTWKEWRSQGRKFGSLYLTAAINTGKTDPMEAAFGESKGFGSSFFKPRFLEPRHVYADINFLISLLDKEMSRINTVRRKPVDQDVLVLENLLR